MVINPLAQTLQEGMGLRQSLTAGPLLLAEKGNSIESEAVHPTVQPEIDDLQHRLLHPWIGVVEIGLMTQEPVQVVLLCNRIPLPVGRLEMSEEDWRIAVALGIVTPDVDIALRAVLRGPARSLEPWMEIAGVIENQVEDDAHPLAMSRREKAMERCKITQIRMNACEIGDVIPPIPQGRWIDRRQPQGLHSEPAQIGQTSAQAFEIADTVSIAVGVAAHDQLIDDCS